MSSLGNKTTMAKNLSYYLKKSGKSQREMAELIGVSPAAFSDWINGRKYPRIDKIELLANYFGILKSDLIEDKPSSSLPPAQLVKNLSLDQLKALAADEKFALYNGDDSNAITRDVLEIAALHAIKNGKSIPAEEPPQEDSLTREIIDIVRSLPPDQQQEALNYVQYLSDRAHK